MIAVPAVHHRLHLLAGYGGHNRPRRLSVVCLSGSNFVEFYVVDNTARLAICIGHLTAYLVLVLPVHLSANAGELGWEYE